MSLSLFGMIEKHMIYQGKHLGNKDKIPLEDFRDMLKLSFFDKQGIENFDLVPKFPWASTDIYVHLVKEVR